MASSYLRMGTHMIATWRLRSDTYRADPDIAKDPAVLAERVAYEERRHCGVQNRDDDGFWLEDN